MQSALDMFMSMRYTNLRFIIIIIIINYSLAQTPSQTQQLPFTTTFPESSICVFPKPIYQGAYAMGEGHFPLKFPLVHSPWSRLLKREKNLPSPYS